jgi:hypothetical protein
MKDKWLVSTIDRLSPKSVVLWEAFASAVLAGLGGVRWAALAACKSENGEAGSKPAKTIASDPFVLRAAGVTGQSQNSPSPDMSQDTASGRVLKWPAIRIPDRRALRRPFQPPLVPAAVSEAGAGLPQPEGTTTERPAI